MTSTYKWKINAKSRAILIWKFVRVSAIVGLSQFHFSTNKNLKKTWWLMLWNGIKTSSWNAFSRYIYILKKKNHFHNEEWRKWNNTKSVNLHAFITDRLAFKYKFYHNSITHICTHVYHCKHNYELRFRCNCTYKR